MKIRIITNGDVFKVQAMRKRKWKTEQRWVGDPISLWLCDIEFRSYRKAAKYVRRQFGAQADLVPRKWRQA